MEYKCKRCGYKWKYRGKLAFGTCPNCNLRQKIRDWKMKPES